MSSRGAVSDRAARRVASSWSTRESFLASLGRSRERGGVRSPEPALRGSYRALYDHIPLMCFTLDAAGGVLAVNPQGARELGYRSDELIDRPVLEVFHPEDRPAVSEQLRTALAHPDRVSRWRFRKVRKDGTVLWVQEAVRVVQEDERTILLVVCEDVTSQVEAEAADRYQDELRALTSELTLAEERERRRIGEGLHDHLGQTLAMVKMWLGTLKDRETAEERGRTVDEIQLLLDEALRETRSLSFELSSPILDHLGLEEALSDLGDRLLSKAGIAFRFSTDSRPKPLAEGTGILLFRAARELLVNVSRHARARTARLAVSRVGDAVRITVEDDGIGIEHRDRGRRGPSPAGGLGLFKIRERLQRLGGRLEIAPAAAGGTRAVLAAPLCASAADSSKRDSRPDPRRIR